MSAHATLSAVANVCANCGVAQSTSRTSCYQCNGACSPATVTRAADRVALALSARPVDTALSDVKAAPGFRRHWYNVGGGRSTPYAEARRQDLESDGLVGRADHQERQENRRDRLESAAVRADRRADQLWNNADAIAAHIPIGQPVLAGHHSERRHRRDLAKIDRDTRASIKERKRAASLERRAAAVGSGGISSDDGGALSALAAKLEKLELQREEMKAFSAAWRKAKKPTGSDFAKFAGNYTGRVPFGAASLVQNLEWSGAPVPAYALTNLGAKIRSTRKRLEQLTAEADRRRTGDVLEIEGDGFEITEEENRVRILFDSKPPADVRAVVKAAGFRWARSVGAWQRLANESGRAAAKRVAAQLAS